MTEQPTNPSNTPPLEMNTSRQFTAWLAEQNASLVFTTYQAGKLFLIGLKEDGALSVFERSFERCMGLYVQENTLLMSSLYQLWRFENALQLGQNYQGYDKLFVPKLGYVTGDLDIHDISLDRQGRIIFVNTLFSCLAMASEQYSFQPIWQPKFISRLAAEDRCHLNGLAMEAGLPKYVTAVSPSDIADGWRDHREKGGCVIDVASNEIVVEGLSMPHSPRVSQGKLWVHNSGTGEFGWVDVPQGKFIPVAFCPGYLRGLSFIANYAVIGLSKPRHNKTFSGLDLDKNLQDRKVESRCAIYIIDLQTGDSVHWLRIEGVIEELYDVMVLPGVRRPTALGFKSDEIRRVITMGEPFDILEQDKSHPILVN